MCVDAPRPQARLNFGRYILDAEGRPVPEPNLYKWAEWFETGNRIVKLETIGAYHISTIFLGLDHNFSGHGPPILWETMVFGVGQPMLAQRQDRCAGSREQAEAMHAAMVERILEPQRRR